MALQATPSWPSSGKENENMSEEKHLLSLRHPTQQLTNRSEPSLWNTTEQQHHSQECNNSTAFPTKMTKDQRQWTSEQRTGKKKANHRARKDITTEKESSNTKEKDTASKEKENNRTAPSDKEIQPKEHHGNTGKGCHQHTTKEKEKERQTHATGVARQVASPDSAR